MILLLFVDVQVRLCIGNIFLKYVIIYAGYFSLFIPHPDFGCICPKEETILRWKSVPLEREHKLWNQGASGVNHGSPTH